MCDKLQLLSVQLVLYVISWSMWQTADLLHYPGDYKLSLQCYSPSGERGTPYAEFFNL
jgi:hypothetical protein